MREWIVLTIIGEDRPGLVGDISGVIVAHGGNWEESRMARLAGRFAGILQVGVDADKADGLKADLANLERKGLSVHAEVVEAEPTVPPMRRIRLELTGQDREGIVCEISRALAEREVNVQELQTERTSAPMSGEPMFRAQALLWLPVGVELESLQAALEAIAHDLIVDLHLTPSEV